MQENRAKIKSENPELSLGELSSKAGEIWRTISDSDKSVWDAKAAEDRRRYKLEMKRWESEQSSKKSSKYSKKSQENTSKFSKDSSSASGIIPDFQLYGNANDLLWFGDDEDYGEGDLAYVCSICEEDRHNVFFPFDRHRC